MTDIPQSAEDFLKEELKSNKESLFMLQFRAKNMRLAGFEEQAKANAENAAKVEAYIKLIEKELKGLAKPA